MYNLAVDEDESYTADGCVVHNCQDYSVAKTLNQAAGIVGKKGVLWWEIHRLLTMKRPPYLFLENVDRLLKSPTSQRGRDFGVMLATLADLGYEVEWRVVNAADYGFPQKRRRVLIVGRLAGEQPRDPNEVIHHGTLARALPITPGPTLESTATFSIDGDAAEVSASFGATKGESPFRNAGYMSHRRVWTLDVDPAWDGPRQVLGDILEPADEVPEEYFVPADQLPRWEYLKGAKREPRYHKGSDTPYFYVEGPHPVPRPDGLARSDDPHRRRRPHPVPVQAPHPGGGRSLPSADPSRAGAPQRLPGRLDGHRHDRWAARLHDGQCPRRRPHRASRPRADARIKRGLRAPRVAGRRASGCRLVGRLVEIQHHGGRLAQHGPESMTCLAVRLERCEHFAVTGFHWGPVVDVEPNNRGRELEASAHVG